jgi:hypothetical protein
MDVLWEPARFAQPRFRRVRDLLERIATPAWPSVAAIDEAFAPELRDVGIRLIEAPKTRAALAADGTIDPASLYEVRIVECGEVPTRPNNLHDLLNAVVWAAFPRSKLALTRRLAEIQRARAIGRATLPSARSREHDRLAMIDEGAVLRVGGESWIFGHAIYEHAYGGHLDVRGGAVDLVVAEPSRAAIDRAFAGVDFAAALRPGPGVHIDDM